MSLDPDFLAMFEDNAEASLSKANTHYENFPVASFVLPKRLRHPIALIYNFARHADDIADEGEHKPEYRVAMLQAFRHQLNLIEDNEPTKSIFFKDFGDMVRQHNLPLAPFYDLLDAFGQDVVKTRYANFTEVLDYCRRSANPIGALLLYLFNEATPENIIYSNKVCTALQLINFYQDVAIDYDRPLNKSRIYLCQDEMAEFGISEAQIAAKYVNSDWGKFMLFNIERAEQMLKEGKPLENVLPGRIGLEMRMIIGGGQQVVNKLKAVRGDVFKYRPTLSTWDWPLILIKALLR